uniref:Triacylglycerol lipase n=1 Tax=Salarias fasciatus TaxID=181472 RepID=A0A672HZ78_SALFA
MLRRVVTAEASPAGGLSVCTCCSAAALEVCYDELGCFEDLPPWGGTAQRPAAILPWSPQEVGTRFLLFTQKNRYYQEIKPDQSIQASNYGGRRKTRFVIPGLVVTDDEDWPQEMCKVMVKQENVNCIAVEWKKGARTQYAQAANNARVVGAQVASMLSFLMGRYKQTADKFHIIGHGVGAHAAGEAGSRTPGLARITGLDPAEPYFQDTDAAVRLDAGDASFVDAIHTDALPFSSGLGLGMSRPVGPPSELDAIWQGDSRFDACNHARAYLYYEESLVQPRGFVGFPCSDSKAFAAGQCFSCPDGSCPLMGHHADKSAGTDGVSKTKYFLNTGRTAPFSRYSFRVSLTLDGPSWPNPGFMYVALAGQYGTTQEHQLHVGTLVPGRTYDMLLDAELDVGRVEEVRFRWNNHILNPMRPRYGASRVALQRGSDQETWVFCGMETVVENAVQAVPPC